MPCTTPTLQPGVVGGWLPLVMSHLPSGHCLTPEISTLQLHWYQQLGLSALWPLCRVSAKRTRMLSLSLSTHFSRWHHPGSIINSFPVSPMGGKGISVDGHRGFTPFQESSLTVLVSSSLGGLPPDCTRSWLSVADGAAQMERGHTSTKSEAWLAVPILGSKLNPSMGLLFAVAGCPGLLMPCEAG